MQKIFDAERKMCRTKIDSERTVLTVRFYRISIRDLKGAGRDLMGAGRDLKGAGRDLIGSWQGPKG